jgi:hypothetical protein
VLKGLFTSPAFSFPFLKETNSQHQPHSSVNGYNIIEVNIDDQSFVAAQIFAAAEERS